MSTENRESCSQRDSTERKGYVRVHRSFNRIWKERDSAEPDILGKILDKDNLNVWRSRSRMEGCESLASRPSSTAGNFPTAYAKRRYQKDKGIH